MNITVDQLRSPNGATLYAARCNLCGEIECCNNGIFTEAAGRLHVKEQLGHEVIVGFVLIGANTKTKA